MNDPWHLYLMALLYTTAGVNHFIFPYLYMRVMPKYLPRPKLLVYLSGLVEILIGILLCMPLSRNTAIILLIMMLLLFLIVHFYMLANQKASVGLPKWVLILRIPLQFMLMYWAYSYYTYSP